MKLIDRFGNSSIYPHTDLDANICVEKLATEMMANFHLLSDGKKVSAASHQANKISLFQQ